MGDDDLASGRTLWWLCDRNVPALHLPHLTFDFVVPYAGMYWRTKSSAESLAVFLQQAKPASGFEEGAALADPALGMLNADDSRVAGGWVGDCQKIV